MPDIDSIVDALEIAARKAFDTKADYRAGLCTLDDWHAAEEAFDYHARVEPILALLAERKLMREALKNCLQFVACLNGADGLMGKSFEPPAERIRARLQEEIRETLSPTDRSAT